MKGIKDINHVSINVKDMDASIDFYQDILGFEKLKSVDMPEMDLDITYFQMSGVNSMLELIHYSLFFYIYLVHLQTCFEMRCMENNQIPLMN